MGQTVDAWRMAWLGAGACAHRWELVSSVPGVSLLLRRYAPNDTYTITKQVITMAPHAALVHAPRLARALLCARLHTPGTVVVCGLGWRRRSKQAASAFCVVQGASLRVDGTLMGINEEATMTGGGLIPEWQRGAFSLIYECEPPFGWPCAPC